MKQKFLYILIGCSVVLPNVASANLGETEQQIEARYGKPIGRWLDYLGEKKAYRGGGFLVSVNYLRGVSRMERFSKLDDSHFSRVEINRLLNANGDGRHWNGAFENEQPATLEWRTSDGSSRVAFYNQLERVLTVSTQTFLDKTADAARRDASARKLKNL